LTSATSSMIAVSPAAASRLTIQSQPPPTATVGVAFSQQPVIRIEDQFGNLRSGDNGTAVTATRSAGSGTLQGTTAMTAVNGVVSYTNLAHNLASTITVTFTSVTLTTASSGNFIVIAAAAGRLAS